MDPIAYALAQQVAADTETVEEIHLNPAAGLFSSWKPVVAMDPTTGETYYQPPSAQAFYKVAYEGLTSVALAAAPRASSEGQAGAWREVNGVKQVYSRGGGDSGKVECFLYDVASNTWTTKANMLAYARLWNGFVWHQGRDELYSLTDYESSGIIFQVYNPTTNTWAQRATPTHKGALAYCPDNGLLYSIGGIFTESAACQAYDPASDTWTTKANMPVTVAYHAVGSVKGSGEVLALFGQSPAGSTNVTSIYSVARSYDIATNTWSTSPADLKTRGYTRGILSGSSAVTNRAVYMVGGYKDATSGTYHTAGAGIAAGGVITASTKRLLAYLAAK